MREGDTKGSAQHGGPVVRVHGLAGRVAQTGAFGGIGVAEFRTFETGATRNLDASKYDYEGFLSPLVMERFGQYMHKHRVQADGSLRDSDNWQKGIPLQAYMK